MNRLTSRKFLLALGIVIADLLFVITGHEVDPEIIVSLHAIAAAWITGETVLDRQAISVDQALIKRLFLEQAQYLAKQIDQETKAPDFGPTDPSGL